MNFLSKKAKPISFSPGNFGDEIMNYSKGNKTSFHVSNTALTPKDLNDFSTVVSSSSLEKVSLVGCRISSSNQIMILCDALKSISTLQEVNLSDNQLSLESVELLADLIKARDSLEVLVLNDCSLSSESCKYLRDALKMNKNLKSLNLAKNALSDEGVKYICQGVLDSNFGEKSIVQHINVSNTALTDEGCKVLGSVLASCESLRKLDVSKNNIKKAGAKFLAHGLMKRRNSSGFDCFNISSNTIGDEGIDAISKRLPSLGSIKILNISKVGMTTVGAMNLFQAVKASDAIENIILAANNLEIGSIGTGIIDLLTNTSELHSLDLSKTQMTKESLKELSKFIGNPIKCRLKNLRLSDAGVDDEISLFLANALKTNMELRTLDVTSNPLTAKGAKSFGKVFKRAKNLDEFRITGLSRIGAEGENYLAECLKWNRRITIKGASCELDYMDDFMNKQKAFVLNADGEMVDWSEAAWEVVKRGCGQIIASVIYNMDKQSFAQFKKNVLPKRNVVHQDMFEYVLRHAEAPALDTVNVFVNKCKMPLDSPCGSKASVAMVREKRKADDNTYRYVAKDCAKDPMVKEMAKNNRLFLGRYLTANGPAIHETHEITRFRGVDTMATGDDKNRSIFIQIYENEMDFIRECSARDDMKNQMKAAGPFALYDTILKEVDIHEENNVVAFYENISDLRHCISNLGVTAGFDLHETIFLAKRAVQCLGTVNNLGRVHGDFRPRNFLKVAKKRMGTDPVGRTNKQVLLPDKWVVFDFSKSVQHGDPVELRMDSSYIPPEVARITFNANYSDKQLPIANEKMDVWAFGVVLFQLLTGTHLFHVEANTDRIFRERERLELMNWINLDEDRQRMILHRCNESMFMNRSSFLKIKTSAVDLVNWCLQGDPYNRPSFNEILTHPFFVYKTNINYSDVDLLLGWYKKIGSNMAAASHKNNRVHAYVANAISVQTADVYNTLKFYYDKVGGKISNEAEDVKLDIDKRREKVQKARTLIILMEKDVLWRPEIMQKLLWAMDSIETSNLILIDVSTAFTNAQKFVFEEYMTELETEDGKERLRGLVRSLLPIEDKLYLTQIGYENDSAKQAKWLENYILDEVNEYIMSLKDKIIPYRTREFQTKAMCDEILSRSGFVAPMMLRKFNLFDNTKYLFEEKEEQKEAGTVKILILYNEDTVSSSPEKIRQDALLLRQKLVSLESKNLKPEILLISSPADVYKHFNMESKRVLDSDGKVESTRVLNTDTQIIVLCLVTEGFYETFREQVVLLDNARGLVSVLPIAYGSFNVAKQGKEAVLNLGLPNKDIISKLQDNRSYIPLPELNGNLRYETDAAMHFITKEAAKVVELTKENAEKSENDVYTRYSKTNFFNSVY